MKKNLIFIIPFVLVLSFVAINFSSINPRKLTTDSGFDSSWDSGSSWDRDSSRGSGGRYGRGSSGDSLTEVVIFLVIFIIVMVWVIISVRKFQEGSSYYYNNNVTKANLEDYGLKKSVVVNDISELFIKYQKDHFIN